jgi:hypothetical protein
MGPCLGVECGAYTHPVDGQGVARNVGVGQAKSECQIQHKSRGKLGEFAQAYADVYSTQQSSSRRTRDALRD